MSESPATACVVIPCRNNARTIEATLWAVAAQTVRDQLRIVLVDNGSTDATVELARHLVHVTLVERVPGSAAVRNAGLAQVHEPIMLSLDADCVPSPTWAEIHIAALAAASPDVLASAGRTVPRPTADRWAQRADITPHPAFSGDVPLYAVAGNAAYRSAALRSLGGFPHYGCDDAALGVVARHRGMRFVWTPGAVVEHRNGSGPRRYARQMRKVGAYQAELIGRPPMRAFGVDVLRRLAGALRPLGHGDKDEALALAIGVTAASVGAIGKWRSPDRPPPLNPDRPWFG